MRKGDLVRYYKNSVTRRQRDEFETRLTYEKAIVVENYTGNKLVKIHILTSGETKKVHASQVQIHKRGSNP
tara:strand:- start:401 stop:613 length:213 start_codon:yes stop_codon:yes gene_type:complete